MVLFTCGMRPERKCRTSRMKTVRIAPVRPPQPGEDYRYPNCRRIARRVCKQMFVLSVKGMATGARCIRKCFARKASCRFGACTVPEGGEEASV